MQHMLIGQVCDVRLREPAHHPASCLVPVQRGRAFLIIKPHCEKYGQRPELHFLFPLRRICSAGLPPAYAAFKPAL